MVIATIQSENLTHSAVPNQILKEATGNCVSVTTQAVATGVAGNGVISPHATTVQELMAVEAEPIRKAADNIRRQDILKACQRSEKAARWRCRPFRVAPVICRNRGCRTQHWHCLFGIMLRTAELVRHNQQLQRRISELQRETDIFLKSVPVQSAKVNDDSKEASTSDSECETSRSPSLVDVDISPPNSVESNYDSN